MLALADLLLPVTPEQAENSILDLAAKLGLPTNNWRKGGVTLSLITIVAYVYSAFTQIAALAIAGGFLDYATGGWLTLLARNGYGVTRFEATFAKAAQGITLTNGGGGLYVIEPGDLTFSATIGGVKKTYRNTSGGTLNPGPGTTLDLDIQADEIGTASNATPGQITVIETTLLGVTCSNGISVLGQDAEPDPALRQRCRDKLGALSLNGPSAAYRYWATSATRADGTSIGVTRVRIPTPPGDGSLSVYVATVSGAVPGTVGDTSTDLGIIDDLIQKYAVPTGVGPVTVASASALDVAITADVYVDSAAGLSTPDVTGLVSAALSGYFPKLPIGGQTGKVYRNALIGVIEAASPYIIKADVSSPAGDTSVATNEVPVYGSPTINVHQVTL